MWNKRQGKTVKVGSLRWLEASVSRRWSSIRLSDVRLLVLRCLILILLAVALAKPVWEAAPVSRQSSKAVYISPELLHSNALRTIKPTVDALLHRGYTLHSYSPTFTPIPEEQWLALSSNPVDSVLTSGNYWALLPALAQRYPQAQDSVWLFTSDQQRNFAGTPAALQENIRWIPVALETTTSWIQAAYATPTDSLQLILGHSTRAGTTFSRSRVAAHEQIIHLANGKQVQLVPQGDTIWAQGSSGIQGRVLVRKQPLRIGIAPDKAQQPEVRYLQAAIKAISHYTGIPMQVDAIPSAAQPGTPPDWLFWLSSKEIRPFWLQQAQEQGTNVWLQPASEPLETTAYLASAGGEIRIHQLAAATPVNTTATTAWYTSAGEPLLTRQLIGSGSVYYFRSGFSPAWSQLGQSAQLPELLLPLLLPQEAASVYDARTLDEEQLKPAIQPVRVRDLQQEQLYKLMPWVVLLAFFLFLAERFITSKRATV
ncbi:hypothetical protein OB13_15715 [Pontibacter sp. HJ8]